MQYLVIEGAFPREVAEDICTKAWASLAPLGVDAADPSTWDAASYTRTDSICTEHAVKDVAPAAWHALLELCGGADRVVDGGEGLVLGASGHGYHNGVAANLCKDRDLPWEPPHAEMNGWHCVRAQTAPVALPCRAANAAVGGRTDGTTATSWTAQSRA